MGLVRRLRLVIVVTGGRGFIGANLVASLVARGERVRVLDDDRAANPDAVIDGVELVVADVCDPSAVGDAFAGARVVIHLAAAGNVAQSVEDPFANFEVNARGTLVALDAARRAGVSRFVFASTGGALVGDAEPPVDEDSVPRPISPYGASKLAGEGYLHAFRGSYGLDTVALRFANVYGPRSAHKRGAVTRFITRALAGEPLEVYGGGHATRDFIYVDDLCAGILAALDRPDHGGVFHLASGRETSVVELARLVIDATGSDSEIVHAPARTGEIERNFATAHRARDVLGWRASTPLEDGLARTVAWFRHR